MLFRQSDETQFTLVHEAGGVKTVVNGIAADVDEVDVVMLGGEGRTVTASQMKNWK